VPERKASTDRRTWCHRRISTKAFCTRPGPRVASAWQLLHDNRLERAEAVRGTEPDAERLSPLTSRRPAVGSRRRKGTSTGSAPVSTRSGPAVAGRRWPSAGSSRPEARSQQHQGKERTNHADNENDYQLQIWTFVQVESGVIAATYLLACASPPCESWPASAGSRPRSRPFCRIRLKLVPELFTRLEPSVTMSVDGGGRFERIASDLVSCDDVRVVPARQVPRNVPSPSDALDVALVTSFHQLA